MNVDEDESETSSIEIPEPMYNGGIMRRSSIKMVNKNVKRGRGKYVRSNVGKGSTKNYLQRNFDNRCNMWCFHF